MAEKKRRKRKKTVIRKRLSSPAEETMALYTQIDQLEKKVTALGDYIEHLSSRLEDAEIHINLLTRFVTTVCVEKMGMRVGVLKRLLKRVEQEAVRESQISHLESLYNMPLKNEAANFLSKKIHKKDRWDEIS